MQIQLEHIYYNDVQLKVESLDKKITSKLKTSLDFTSTLINDEESNKFSITFLLQLENKNFKFSVNAVAQFVTSEVLENKFLDSSFCYINAPAIAFPYLRAYVSNITLNSGFNPIILPSFNFVNLHKERIKEVE